MANRGVQGVIDVRTAHTAELDASALEAARELMYITFQDELTDQDWEHALGGVHATLWDADRLIAHGSVIQRRLIHQGRALRAGYVEAVAVHPDRRREGLGAAVMKQLESVVRGAYEVGALGAAEGAVGFYETLGWERWRGRTSALTPAGLERTEEEDGYIYVLPVSAALGLDGELTCDWRDGDVW